jgi:flagellar motility protein MotE (MotC chaperone)
MTSTEPPHDRYRILSPLGRGGMGHVWRAEDLVLNRMVALKMVTLEPGRPGDREAMIERALREARALAGISHPSVLEIYDVFVRDGAPWLVMKLVNGCSLAERIAVSGTLDEREAARIALRVLGALRAAHGAGVLHRDVKPANILLDRDGRVFLADFGIARIAGAPRLTSTNALLGTLEFMSPEQVALREPTGASDLWSLGVTLFCALEGYSPFRRGGEDVNPAATINAISHDPVPECHRSGRLTAAIQGLLDKDPATRLDAPGLRRILESVLDDRPGKPVHERTTSGNAVPRKLRFPVPPPPEPPAPEPGRIGADALGERLGELLPERAAELLTELEDDAARDVLLEAGPEAAGPVLRTMPGYRVALVLASMRTSDLAGFLDAMAVNPEAAALVLQILSAEKGAGALASMNGPRALAVLGSMSAGEAARVIAQAETRTIAWALGKLPRDPAVEILERLRARPAARALAYLAAERVADLIRGLSPAVAAELMEHLEPRVRDEVERRL